MSGAVDPPASSGAESRSAPTDDADLDCGSRRGRAPTH